MTQVEGFSLSYAAELTDVGGEDDDDDDRVRDAHTAAVTDYQQYVQWATHERAGLDQQLTAVRHALAQANAELDSAQTQVVEVRDAAGRKPFSP